MASEIKVDTIVNAGGDNDTGIDLATNDQVKVKLAGTEVAKITTSEVSFNENSADVDFRVESNDSANMLFVNAGTNKVGIGTSSPAHAFSVVTSTDGTGVSGDDSFVAIFHNAEATTDRSYGVKIKAGSSGNDQSLTVQDHDGSNDLFTIKGSGLINSQPTADNGSSSSANMVITSGGEFAKSTSSRKYKNTIKDATHGLADLLKLRSVTFKGNNDGDTIFGGLIAEEVHDAGLTEFVVYDDDNKPDALHYTHMVALCVKSIQELSAKNDALEARIKKLEDG